MKKAEFEVHRTCLLHLGLRVHRDIRGKISYSFLRLHRVIRG